MSQNEIKTVVSRFTLDESLPTEIIVMENTPEGNATRLFSVRAHYGWAEAILCSGCYLKDANDIANTIGEFLNVPVREFEVEL